MSDILKKAEVLKLAKLSVRNRALELLTVNPALTDAELGILLGVTPRYASLVRASDEFQVTLAASVCQKYKGTVTAIRQRMLDANLCAANSMIDLFTSEDANPAVKVEAAKILFGEVRHVVHPGNGTPVDPGTQVTINITPEVLAEARKKYGERSAALTLEALDVELPKQTELLPQYNLETSE